MFFCDDQTDSSSANIVLYFALSPEFPEGNLREASIKLVFINISISNYLRYDFCEHKLLLGRLSYINATSCAI